MDWSISSLFFSEHIFIFTELKNANTFFLLVCRICGYEVLQVLAAIVYVLSRGLLLLLLLVLVLVLMMLISFDLYYSLFFDLPLVPDLYSIWSPLIMMLPRHATYFLISPIATFPLVSFVGCDSIGVCVYIPLVEIINNFASLLACFAIE